MDRPQRAAAAVAGKGKTRAVQPFRDIAGRVHLDEEEGHPLVAGLLQGRQSMGRLLEACPELPGDRLHVVTARRSEEHTSELQSLMPRSYAVFCLKKNKKLQHT